jgi:RNA polymerase sigma-70 factor (ECF subfamily)
MTPEKLEQELERLHAESFAWALGCCSRDRAEAEDVLQEAYLKILQGRARFLGRSSLKTFFFSVIRRTASEHRRRALWRRFLPLGSENDGLLREPLPHEPAAASVERRIFVGRALQALARRQREVLTLVFAHGLTVEESAITLGISVGTARVHYQRGKARMAVLLRGER